MGCGRSADGCLAALKNYMVGASGQTREMAVVAASVNRWLQVRVKLRGSLFPARDPPFGRVWNQDVEEKISNESCDTHVSLVDVLHSKKRPLESSSFCGIEANQSFGLSSGFVARGHIQ